MKEDTDKFVGEWQDVSLEFVKLPGDTKMEYAPKRVWRGIARL